MGNLFVALFFFFVTCYIVRAIIMGYFLCKVNKMLFDKLEELYGRCSDERLLKDYLIDLSKANIGFKEEVIVSDFIHLFRPLDSSRWITNETKQFLNH